MNQRIAIITVTYNAISTLEATINSVLNQNKELFEYWIIDGGSTDGSIEIIKKYSNQLAGWISEPDKGIYDAMNKGIEKTQCQWLYFLGADDTLLPNVLDEVKSYMSENYYLLYGDVITNNGRRVPSFFSRRIVMQNTIHHQGAFYNRSLFENFRYNTQLSILSDYELNLKIYYDHLPVRKLPMIVACCREGGASSDIKTALSETDLIRKDYVSNEKINKMWSMLLKTYYLQKQVRAFIKQKVKQ